MRYIQLGMAGVTAAHPRSATPEGMPHRSLLLGLFLLSGAAALVYQIYWTRLLTLAIGSTTFAVSVVLASFMTGLAFGALYWGRLADRNPRPLRLYASLELGIAASALLLPHAVRILSAFYPALYAAAGDVPWVLPVFRLLVSFFLLLVPCMLIGGTLPVLVRYAARAPEQFGRDFGWLYGMNTLGAVTGCLLAGFYLLGRIGLSATNHVAVGASLFLAAAFALLDLRGRASVPPAEKRAQLSAPSFHAEERLVFGVAVLSGFTILALEVLWTRALLHALWSTTYSFTAVLATLLLALALGSLLAARWSGGGYATRPLLHRLAVVEIVFSGLLILELPLLGQLVYLKEYYSARLGEDWALLAKFLTAAVLVFAPATIGGMFLPLSARILSSRMESIGGALGWLYLGNTLAAAFGAVAAGFLLIPALGSKLSYLALAMLHVCVAVLLGWLASRRSLAYARQGRAWMAAAPLFLAAALLLSRGLDRPDLFGDPRLQIPGLEMELLAYRESPDANFAVYRQQPGDLRYLYINGFVAASAERQSDYMPMMSHLPLLLHPDPRRVLVIAFGTGSTVGAAALHPVERIDTVDVSRDVYELAGHFASANHNVLADSRVHALVEDGRNFVQAVRESYDVITSEPMPPKFSGMVNFYTRDYYLAARRRLAAGGILCQWLPFHLVSEQDARVIVGTFLDVFPDASLWVIRGTGLLIGGVETSLPSREKWEARMALPAVAADLRRLGFDSPQAIWKTLTLDHRGLAAFRRDAPAMSDDFPYLEFSSDQPAAQSRAELPVFAELRRLRAETQPGDRWVLP